tara:strand:- start:208 stop:654 length:447 start_codon:yes stop_codon:yes gene_type:complete
MEQSILYYNNETNTLQFGGVDNFESGEDNANNFLIIMLYILGFYHLSWYIVNSSRQFRYEELNKRLADCRTIFRIMNEKFEMFDKNSVENMNTTHLLEETLDFFNTDGNSTDEETHEDSEDSSESRSNEEIEAAKTLTSMGKNWEFNQ